MLGKFLLSIVLLSFLSNSQLNLETQYCSLQTGTVGEIVYEINENPAGRVETEFLLKTQTYQSNGKLVSLSYFEDQGSLKIEESDSTLNSISHQDGTSNHLLYIDGINNKIIAKEITDQNTGEFNYVLLTANLGTAGTMSKSTMSSKVDSSNNDISGLNLVKIIDLNAGNILVLFTGKQRSSVYKIQETSGQASLVFWANLSTTEKVNIVGGNSQYIFSADKDVAYVSSSSSASDYQLKTYTQLGLTNVHTSASLKIQKLRGLTLTYSFRSGVTKFYPIQIGSSSVPVVNELSGNALYYSDNNENFLAITSNDLIWYRMTGSTLSVKKLSSSGLNATEKASILSVFNLAHSVSFDGVSALIVTREASYVRGSVYSVSFTPSAAKEFTIVNSVLNSVNLETDIVESLNDPTEIMGFKTQIGCNCVSPSIERFECYSNALKCITVSGVKRQTCNKTL